MKRVVANVLAMSLAVSLIGTAADVKAAKKKIKLSRKSIIITEGKSKKIKIKNIKKKKIKKLTVKSTNKKIATVKKVGNKKTAFKVRGKKQGNVKVRIKIALKGKKKKKTLTLKVKVTQKTETPQTKPTTKPTASTEPGTTPEITATPEPTSSTEPETTATPEPSPEPTTSTEPETTATPTPEPSPEASADPEPVASISVENLMVKDNRTLYVVFSESCILTTDDIVVKTKATKQGNYGEALVIESIEQEDVCQYTIVLKNTTGNYIVNNGYAQISITGLNEAPLVAEDQYEREYVTTTREWTYRCTVGSTSAYNVLMDLDDEDVIGTFQYEVQGTLPSGLYYKPSGKFLYLRGTPEAAGTYKYVLSITDEVGNNFVYNCTCLIGDAGCLNAFAQGDCEMVGEQLETNVYASGGSGSYTYTKVDGNYDFAVSSTGKVTAEFDTEGTYKVYVDVTDVKDTTLTTRVEVVFQVVKAYTVSGVLKDLGGSGIDFRGSGLRVYVRPQDPQIYEEYFDTTPLASTDSATSSFTLDVPAGVYDIYVEDLFGSLYKVVKGVEVKDKNVDAGTIELLLCQVTLSAPNKDSLYQVFWRDENDVVIGRNGTFTVRPGTYTLYSDPYSGSLITALYDFTVTFTATNESVEKVVMATPSKDRVIGLQQGEEASVSLNSSARKVYKFSPEKTGTYRFYSSDLSEELYFNVYSDTQYEHTSTKYLTFTYADQTCDNGSQVNKSVELEKGTTYYIELEFVKDDKEDSFVLGVEKVE